MSDTTTTETITIVEDTPTIPFLRRRGVQKALWTTTAVVLVAAAATYAAHLTGKGVDALEIAKDALDETA